jgi:hypothetical protein
MLVVLIQFVLHGLCRLVHRLVEINHVVQVGVQKVILQILRTVNVILALPVNLVLYVIPMRVPLLLVMVIYIQLFLMMMRVCRRLLLRKLLDLCSVLARAFFQLSLYIITLCFSGA